MKKIYGPDIHKRGTSIVTIYTEKQKEGVLTEEKEKKILMEYHTDNPIYANIYFDAVSNIINDIPEIYTRCEGLKWRRKTAKIPLKDITNPYLSGKPRHPWSNISPSEYVLKCPYEYKKDLIPYVMKQMKWTKTFTQAKKKKELKQIWAWKNLKHIKKRLSD